MSNLLGLSKISEVEWSHEEAGAPNRHYHCLLQELRSDLLSLLSWTFNARSDSKHHKKLSSTTKKIICARYCHGFERGHTFGFVALRQRA